MAEKIFYDAKVVGGKEKNDLCIACCKLSFHFEIVVDIHDWPSNNKTRSDSA
ncbi:MAG: hypothetical protein KC592_09320 [Nitrospira sp.]|nr:hypothetical protein [Nitrospira sp.]